MIYRQIQNYFTTWSIFTSTYYIIIIPIGTDYNSTQRSTTFIGRSF